MVYAIDFKDQVHSYYNTAPKDPFSVLIKKIENGTVTLEYNSNRSYLRSLLRELGISPHSQLLVYSTTSLQLSRISPSNPRAIYFTDDIYLGYVPGGQIEIIGIDPQLGAIPYIFNLPQPNELKHPIIYRSKRCMNCHASQDIGGAPGLLIGSVIPGPGGGSIDAFRKKIFGHGVPFNQRFGGWHITGDHPFFNSWANQTGIMEKGNILKIPNSPGKYFSWNKYLTEKSGIIPHLLLEHQVGFTNRCLTTTYKFREFSQKKQDSINQPKIQKFIEEESNTLLSYLLFQKEVPLPENNIKSDIHFVIDFESKERGKHEEPSLRKLNLKNRLFNLRCSYMIFSNSFSGLPDQIKTNLLKKLHFILTCEHKKIPSAYSYLEDTEREEIKIILSKSLQGFPNGKKKDAHGRLF